MFSQGINVILKIPWVMIAFIYLPNVLWAQWQRVEVTTGLGWIQEAQVAEGRNDSLKRIYLASPGSRGVYELTWNGTTWDRIQVDSSSHPVRHLFVGEGRNDSVMRIYSTDEGMTLREFTWNGATWNEDTVGQSGIGVAVGPGRNDGITRVYTSSDYSDNYLYERTWEGGAWIEDTLQAGASWFWIPILGNGRNDDTIRVYDSNWDGHVYEFSWNGSTWDVTDVASPTYVTDLAIGAGRNDGVNRLYGAGDDGHLYEYTWEGNNWVETGNLLPSGSTYMREVHVGNGRNDGVIRVYCAGSGSGLTEFSWSGTEWIEETMGAETDALTVGYGRNDGIMRVYAANSGFAEYTYSIGISESRFHSPSALSLEISPNPFRNNVDIRWQITDNSIAEVKIYDAKGRLVKDFEYSINRLSCQISWSCNDNIGKRVPSGLYFIRFTADNYIETRKLILIR